MASQLLINEPPLQVLPTLANIIGLNEAIVLQQIHYWLHPQSNKNYFEGRYWVYNTYEQWLKQFPFYSERTLRRTVRNLEASKILLSCKKGSELNQTKFYTINYHSLEEICLNPQKLILKEINQPFPANEEDPESQESLEYPYLSSSEGDLRLQNQETGASYQQEHHIPSSIWPETKEKNVQNPSYTAKNNIIYPTWSKGPDHVANMSTPSGQSGQTIRSKWPPQLAKLTTPTGQFGHLSYTENTQEITTENNLPPLTPPSLAAAGSKKEEEEEKIIAEPSSTTLSTILPCEKMLQVWNDTVQCKLHPGKEVSITLKRKQLLEELLQTCLNGKLESWQDYCTLIAGSKFLMGQNPSGFKATLEWACVSDNAYKVLEGAIYDKPEVTKNQTNSLPWEEFEGELAKNLPSSPYLLPWLKISLNLAKLMGQEKYRCRFAKVSLKELTQTTATFVVESMVIKDSLIRNYSSELRCAVETVCPTVKHIEFDVCPPQRNPIHPLTTGGPK